MKINGKEYRMIPEMSLGTFIALSELMEEMESDHLTLMSVKRFAADSKRLKKLVCLALDPVEEIDYDKWDDLQHIRLDEVVDVISDFFDLGGPLQDAFRPVLNQAPMKKESMTTTVTSEGVR